MSAESPSAIELELRTLGQPHQIVVVGLPSSCFNRIGVSGDLMEPKQQCQARKPSIGLLGRVRVQHVLVCSSITEAE
jgi:hypothetical protein